MEVIQNNNNKTRRCQKSNGVVGAVILIVVGLIFLGRNLGYVDHQLFRILISWQMLLIVLGICSIVKRRYSSGLVLLAIGAFFLIPRITGWVDGGWARTYWPILLVALGVILIIKKMSPQKSKRCGCRHRVKEVNHSDNGFLNSDNMFGSVKHIILDPVFKGGSVKNSFAGTIIDFRGTKLEGETTYLDIDSLFGGIEIHAPSTWCIISELKPVFGGYDDKRYNGGEVDYTRKLIIRGGLTFSGLEIKN